MAKGSKKVGVIIAIIMTVISASLATALALFLLGVLETDPVKLVFEVKDETKVYDGTPLKASDYTLIEGELPSDVTVEVDFIGEQTNAGTSASDMTVKILDSSNYNVSHKYSIRVEKGTLSVTKRSVDIVMPTQQVEYNGSTVEFTDYRIAEGSTTSLVSGHRVYGSSRDGLLHVGDQLPSDLMPLIYDVAGNDVTSNYEISFAMGKIEIIPREVAVRPVSYSKVYDGQPITVKDVEYVAGSLVDGQYATYSINNDVAARCTLTNAGKLETQVTDFRIFQRINGAAVDVTSNYNVDKTEKGALEITPRQLVIKPTSHTKTYDGIEVDVGVEYLVGTIADGQYLDYELTDGDDPVNSIKNAGNYTVGLSNVHVMQYVADGTSVDVTSNYTITATITGEVKINPRPLTVTAKNGTWQYDGKAHSLKSDTKPLSASGLVDGDSVASVTYDGEINGVGETDNILKSVTLSCPNENYVISKVNGTLKITPCEIIIRTETAEKYYDTEPLTSDISKVTVEKAADGTSGLPVATHTVVLADGSARFPTITNAGTTRNSVPLTIKDGENNVASNYSITFDWGTLTVKKMPVIVTLATDKSATYDGTSKSPSIAESVTVSSVNSDCEQTLEDIFEAGERLELITYVRNMVHAGEYSYSVGFKDYADALNYSLEVKNTGYFTINPMPITVELENYESIAYTTRAYSLDVTSAIKSIKDGEGEDVSVSIIGKNDFVIVCDSDLTSVKEHTYNVKIKDGSNPDDFELTSEDGTVEIIAATVTVTLKAYTGGAAFSYTGSAIEPDMEDAITAISSDLLNKSDFVLDVAAPIIDAGDNYTYKVKIKNEELAGNIDFTSPTQNLEVNKADALIEFNDISTVYNGEEYTLDPVAIVANIDGGTAPLTLSDLTDKYGLTYKYKQNGEHKNVNTYQYGVDFTGIATFAKNFTVKIQNKQNPGGSNKSATWNGTRWSNPNAPSQIAQVEITKFEITITSESRTFTYDGSPHTAEGYSDVLLANSNHEISVKQPYFSVTDVSSDSFGNILSVKNELDYQIKNGGADVTSNYNITKVCGYITIMPREVTVTTPTQTFTYNGLAQTAEQVTADNLVLGHSLAITTSVLPSVTTVVQGYVSNKIEVKIEDSGRKDVTKNYKVKYSYGTINVIKKAVDITTESHTKKYDGNELKLDTPTASGLVPNHKAVINTEAPSLTNVGQIRNEYTCVIKDSNGTGSDVTANYDISYHYGWLKVEKVTVNVTRKAFGSTLTYNGTVQNPATGSLIEISAESGASISADKLPQVTDFDVTFYNSALTASAVLNADTYTCEISPKSYLDLTNFTLKFSGDSITITVDPKPITVELSTLSKITYNGKDQTPDIDKIIKSISDGLLTKSDFVATFADKSSGTESVLLNAGEYTCTVTLGKDIIAGNYSISYNGGTDSNKIDITVGAKTVNAYAREVGMTYNGQVQTISAEDAITITSVEVLEYLSVSDFTITVKNGETIKDAKQLGGDGYEFTISLDNPNFKLEVTKGSYSLTNKAYVDKLTVTITHNISDFVYDGKVHTLNAADVLSFDTDLITPSDVKINITGSKVIKNVDTYNYTVTFNSADFGKNFTWKTGSDSGSFEITKYVVTGSLKDYEKVYDGQAFTVPVNTAVILDNGGLLGGTFALASGTSEMKDAKGYTYKVTYSGDDKGNFDLTAIESAVGNVTIKKLAVGATLYNFDGLIYNGTVRKLSSEFAIILDTGLIQVNETNFKIIAFTATADSGVEFKNAGEYLYRIEYIGTGADNFDFTAAYAARGRVAISPLPVTVTLKDYSKTYDGSVLAVNPSDIIISTTVLTKSELDRALTYTDFRLSSPQPMNAGDYNYTASYSNTSVPESNFVITYVGGKLTITPVDVTITLADFNSFTYDGTKDYSEDIKSDVFGNNAVTTTPSINGVNFGLNKPQMINAGKYTYSISGYTGDTHGNYNFVNLDTVVGHVIVLPKDIYLKFENAQGKEYDGNAYSIRLKGQNRNEILDLMADADKSTQVSESIYNALIDGFMVADGAPEMINAGTYTYRVVYTGDNASNFNFVNISSARGTVEITAKQVTVTLSDFTHTYDGQAFVVPVDTAVSVSSAKGGVLPGGHFRLAAGTPEMKNVKRTGDYPDDQSAASATYYEYSVVYVGNDAGNFTFTYQGATSGTTGRVTITPFGVAITLADFTSTYDGYEFKVPLASALTVNNTLMVGGWNIYVDNEETPGTNKILYAKTYTYMVKYQGEDSANFNITQPHNDVRGTVIIKPASVTVTLPDIVKDYDGVEINNNNTYIKSNIKINSDLLKKDKLEIGEFSYKYAEQYNYANKVGLITGISEDEKKSFKITYEGGNVTINAVYITVTLPDVIKTYDGVGVTIRKSQITYTNSRLFNINDLTIDIQGGDHNTADYVNVGEYNYFTDSKVNYSYGVTDAEQNQEELNNLKKSIIIDYVGGNIEITRLSVTVTLKNYSSVYNGTNFTFTAEDAISTSSELLKPDMFNPSSTDGMKNVGEYSYTVTYVGEADEDNFDITYEGGKIVITPYEITVTLFNVSREFNDKPYVINAASASGSDYTLVEGTYVKSGDIYSADMDYVNIKVDFVSGTQYTDPGEYSFNAKFAFTEAAQGDITTNINKNYILTVEGEGKLTITKYRLTIKLKDKSFDYDGKVKTITSSEAIEFPSETIPVQKEAANFDVVINGTVRDAGTYTYTVVPNSKNGNYAGNYIELIIENEGHITVNKKTVTVELKELTGVYTGLPQYISEEEEFIKSFKDLPASGSDAEPTQVTKGDFRIKYYATMVDAGTYKYTVELINASLLKNYDFVIGDGEYEITKAYVYVELRSLTFNYTGSPVSVEIGIAISNLKTYVESFDTVPGTQKECPTPLTKGDLVIVYNDPVNLINGENTSYWVEFASAAVARNYMFAGNCAADGSNGSRSTSASITINKTGEEAGSRSAASTVSFNHKEDDSSPKTEQVEVKVVGDGTQATWLGDPTKSGYTFNWDNE